MDPQELKGTIPTNEIIQAEIRALQHRSCRDGVSREERNENQYKLSPIELKDRKKRCRDLLSVVVSHIDEFYQLLLPDDFMVAFVDADGFILYLAGSDRVGNRWVIAGDKA